MRNTLAAAERSDAGKAARIQIGEAAARRHTAPIASMLFWAAFCASTVIALHKLSAGWAARQGSYRTGVLTVSVFLLAALYPVRKYTLRLSLRWLRLASRLPRAWAVRLVLLDRLLEAGTPPPVEAVDDWGYAARDALRALEEPRRSAWTRLLLHARDATGARPSARWLQSARPLVAGSSFTRRSPSATPSRVRWSQRAMASPTSRPMSYAPNAA